MHIKPARLKGLPNDLRLELKLSRNKLGWTQTELGRRAGLPQTHISNIENGKTVPRFDTLLDLVRILDLDLLMVPRELVPFIQAQIRGSRRNKDTTHRDEEEHSLYSLNAESGSYSLSGSDAILSVSKKEEKHHGDI